MDDVAEYNRNRWRSLVGANALFSRPKLDLNPVSAAALADPWGKFGDLKNKRVLCLGAGGGQQSAAFAILGSDVTVVDLSPEQLELDRSTADHYKVDIKIVEADMRDLSALNKDFDIVDQPYSINFVPDCRDVFHQVSRVLKPAGLYRFAVANPFAMAIPQNSWTGRGYRLERPYLDGGRTTYADQDWVYERKSDPIPPPIEYRQSLSRVINGLCVSGFSVEFLSDSADIHPDPDAEPGSWDHYASFIPPWFSILARNAN